MKLPLRVRIGLAVGALVLLWSLSQSLGGVLTLSAAALWIAAGAVLLDVAGAAPGGLTGRLAAQLTQLLAPGSVSAAAPASGRASAAVAVQGAAPQAQTKQVELPPDPRAALRRGEGRLAEMIGDDPGRAEIREKLIPQARSFAAKKRPLLGAQRALVLLVSGPSGVGKSSVARALADLLYGLEVVRKPLLCEVPAPSGSRLAPEWSALLEESLDGVALVDDAAWLLQTHPLTGAVHADGFLSAVTQVAGASPGRLALILALRDAQLAEIQKQAAFKDLVRKLSLRHVALAALEPQDLVRVLRAQLERHGLRCPESLSEPLRRMVKRHSDVEGFDHAEAMRRVSESLLESNPLTEGRTVTLEELERAFEYKI